MVMGGYFFHCKFQKEFLNLPYMRLCRQVHKFLLCHLGYIIISCITVLFYCIFCFSVEMEFHVIFKSKLLYLEKCNNIFITKNIIN